MKYFSRMTKMTSSPQKQNIVLMGRKTWESIPSKFRPLPDRINLVLTSKAKDGSADFKGSITCSTFQEAMQEALNCKSDVENVWAIGGSSIYRMALDSEHLHRIYLTRILKNYECDTFLPKFDEEKFQIVTDPAVPTEIQQEGDISYKYEIYEKKK